MNRSREHSHLVLGLLISLFISCSASLGDRPSMPHRPLSPDGTPQDFEEKPIPTKEEWLAAVLKDTGQEPDMVEAATVLAAHRSGVPRAYSTIPRGLEPALRRVRKKLGSKANADEMIDALNEQLLPELRRGRTTDWRWLYDALGSDQGGCAVSVLLYMIAADSIGLRLEVVCIPQHAFLSSITPSRRRDVETTDKGQQMTAQEYRKVISSDPMHIETLPEDAEALKQFLSPISRRQFLAILICLGNPRNAAKPEDFESASKVAPDFYWPLKLMVSYHSGRDDFAAAEEAATKAIKLAPYVPGLYGVRASMRMLQQKTKPALEDADRAIQLCPNYGRYHHARGLVLYTGGSFEQSLESFSRAVEVAPGVPEFWDFRGIVHKKLKRYKEAIGDYTKAIGLDPGKAEYYESRADLWAMVGDEERYEADRRKARELGQKR